MNYIDEVLYFIGVNVYISALAHRLSVMRPVLLFYDCTYRKSYCDITDK